MNTGNLHRPLKADSASCKTVIDSINDINRLLSGLYSKIEENLLDIIMLNGDTGKIAGVYEKAIEIEGVAIAGPNNEPYSFYVYALWSDGKDVYCKTDDYSFQPKFKDLTDINKRYIFEDVITKHKIPGYEIVLKNIDLFTLR